ncbi:LytTR family two component transcriptional regulator [Sphingobacterium allocomposti]|jgi:two-component system LytT family response regulator|uniref:LytTR family two component transcriptional regulator n=1 Tax=Sphingobacterium allocomposti TaxID=415956 RepID=A0A5S5DCP1_9SPHI|nr:LytTR family transcriptional regulator DNA-binding domain-containing protein [Sphingobacterium composti Yoo et al. 2007 non Ten et al. 2007]TYP93138.1 LytTR family two component transcriptional regulator [Sphingobacterium composti Yoo et al. 2007 non Ten et al. 2007]HLS96207.1 LytTR family transcriptional regulator DNA-binding domain-containing protein [Sphingobacterium sp.]
MIKTIVIDDEPLARMIIIEYLKQHTDIEIVAECGDGFEGAKAIHAYQPDLVFLDIQMPKLTGFEMLEILDFMPNVIFTTAFDEFAIKAFEKNAIDYLLKPINKDRFEQALNKFRNTHSTANSVQITEKINSISEEESLERIVVKNGSQIKIIPVQQVNFLEAYDDYVKIHTKDGVFLKNKTMSSFEKQLDPKHFVRVHRSFIAKVDQLAKIEPLEKESYIATLLTGEKINISKSGYARLKQIIGL